MAETVIKPELNNIIIVEGKQTTELNTFFDIVARQLNQLQPAFGSGSPEGVLVASVGKIYIDTGAASGSGLYIKETGDGNTGWIARS